MDPNRVEMKRFSEHVMTLSKLPRKGNAEKAISGVPQVYINIVSSSSAFGAKARARSQS